MERNTFHHWDTNSIPWDTMRAITVVFMNPKVENSSLCDQFEYERIFLRRNHTLKNHYHHPNSFHWWKASIIKFSQFVNIFIKSLSRNCPKNGQFHSIYLFEFFLRVAIFPMLNFEVKSSRLKVHQFSGDYLSKWDFFIKSDFFLERKNKLCLEKSFNWPFTILARFIYNYHPKRIVIYPKTQIGPYMEINGLF